MISVIVLLYYNQFESSADFNNELSPSGVAWCWVRPGYGQLIFYATLVLVIVFNISLTIVSICHVRNLAKYPIQYVWVPLLCRDVP